MRMERHIKQVSISSAMIRSLLQLETMLNAEIICCVAEAAKSSLEKTKELQFMRGLWLCKTWPDRLEKVAAVLHCKL